MKAFFDIVRKHFGPLKQSQVDGIEKLLSAANGLPERHVAYVLATAFHETAKTMQPITEYGGKSYFNKYDGRKDLGNTLPGDGYRFRGRGYVQITGRRNYAKFAKLLSIDLVVNPELALQPDISAKIIIMGMRDGLFTGKKMGDYTAFADMRRVVNGTDKALLIAEHASKFFEAVKTLQGKPVVTPVPVPAPIPAPGKVDAPAPAPAAPMGLLAALIAIILSLFKRKV